MLLTACAAAAVGRSAPLPVSSRVCGTGSLTASDATGSGFAHRATAGRPVGAATAESAFGGRSPAEAAATLADTPSFSINPPLFPSWRNPCF
ncbi:hypothetical protein [Streptomyces sp. NPDC060198]|uniref:hypothetical protein n=1 Tax=Streptomyces sp. NPDC060198 TaxID=3347070 RepID=UPI003652F8FA